MTATQLNTKELKKIYEILKAYDEGLIENPSEEWEMNYFDEPLAERDGCRI